MSTTEVEVVSRVHKELLIGGVWRAASGGGTLAVEDPATGQTLCEIADGTQADAIAALDAADAAAAQWAAHPPRERGEILRRAFEAVAARTDELALLMTLEMGKSLAESRAEIAYANEFLRWFSEEAVRIDGRFAVSPNGQTRLLTMRQPVGPCLLITPWNFPLAMGTRKVAPAIAAGCTMVVKPAQQTPLSMLALAGILEAAGLPAGVLNIVTTAHASAVSEPLLTRVCASSRSPVRPRSDGRSRRARWSASCASRWSLAATPRSSSSPTPTSTPRSRGRCSPRCATSARPARPRTAFMLRRLSPRISPRVSQPGWGLLGWAAAPIRRPTSGH
jgi:hypothetical protein